MKDGFNKVVRAIKPRSQDVRSHVGRLTCARSCNWV